MPHQVAHFWAGKIESKTLFDAFYAENYGIETKRSQPVSQFAASQNEKWLNHDLLEAGFEADGATLREKFMRYSYAEHWIDELEKRVADQGIPEVNTLIMSFLDKEYDPIRAPKAIHQPGIDMAYLGKISFDYEHPDWFQAILDSKGGEIQL